MDINDLKNFVGSINVDEIDSVSVKLVQKVKNEYEVYQPSVNKTLRKDLQELYSEVFSTRLFQLPQENYNPNVGQDGCLSVASLDVANVNTSIEQLESEENIHGDMQEMDLDKINFYCITLSHNNRSLYIFRRFTKMRKIRQGFLTFIENNSLSKVENRLFIGLDRDVDILVFNNETLIINRFALQTIFNLHDYFIERATEALKRIEDGNVISNFEEFKDDCLSDRQASKRITKIINTEGRIEGFLENANLLPIVIEEADLEIELNETGQIVYTSSRDIRSQILFCIADAYYRSMILRRVGEDITQ